MAAPTDTMLTTAGTRLALCAFLDIAGDPVRAAFSPVAIATPGISVLPAADPDFDGQTFTTLDPRFVRVSTVEHGPGGAEAVAFTVSGSLEMDSDLMTALSDPSRFRGRTAKIWIVHLDANWQPDAARNIYTGVMAVPAFAMGADEQTITIVAENYLTLIGSGAPSRTLLSQKDYDAGDDSAAATLATASSGNALGPSFEGGMGGLINWFENWK